MLLRASALEHHQSAADSAISMNLGCPRPIVSDANTVQLYACPWSSVLYLLHAPGCMLQQRMIWMMCLLIAFSISVAAICSICPTCRLPVLPFGLDEQR